MTRLPLAMRRHDGNETTIGMVVRAMASSFIEEDEAFMTQERIHFCKADFSGCVPHLVQKFQTPTHVMASPVVQVE
jgi:hypothetical protein